MIAEKTSGSRCRFWPRDLNPPSSGPKTDPNQSITEGLEL
jgi:hypothetical protein